MFEIWCLRFDIYFLEIRLIYMFKKSILLVITSLVFLGAGCSVLPGSKGSEPAAEIKTDNIPLSVDDGSKSASSVTLDNPQADATLASPFLVSGKAQVPGNKVFVRVKNAAGKAVIEAFTMAQAGIFSVNIDFQFQGTKEGTVEVFGKDATGAEVGLQSAAVKFEPNL